MPGLIRVGKLGQEASLKTGLVREHPGVILQDLLYQICYFTGIHVQQYTLDCTFWVSEIETDIQFAGSQELPSLCLATIKGWGRSGLDCSQHCRESRVAAATVSGSISGVSRTKWWK